jgi:hypothetical protein
MAELVLYLRIVKSSMPADLFSFDYALKVDSTFVVDTPLYSIKVCSDFYTFVWVLNLVFSTGYFLRQ